MSKCDLEIELERPDHVFAPGETVRGEVVVRVNAPCRCDELTITQLWRTHGRGNRTEGPCDRQVLFTGQWSGGLDHRYPFEFTVPNGPVTYHGTLLNVDWYLETRADIPWALDPKAATEFLVAARDGGVADYSFGPHDDLPMLATREQVERWLLGCGLLFMGPVIVGGLLMLGWAITSWRGTAQPHGSDLIRFLLIGLFGSVLLLVGSVVIAGLLRKTVAQRKLGVPEVTIEPTDVRRGEIVSIGVRLSPRAFVRIEQISAMLIGWEEVISGSGTNKTTHDHEIHRERCDLADRERHVGRGEIVAFEGQVTVPPDAAPTFRATDNELHWKVQLAISIAGWPDWDRSFSMTVAP